MEDFHHVSFPIVSDIFEPKLLEYSETGHLETRNKMCFIK